MQSPQSSSDILPEHTTDVFGLRELGVPAWVVGNEGAGGAADVLKLYPQREAVRRMRLPEFDRMIDALMEGHCRRRGRR